jgi:hypothetical protein
MSHQSRPLEQHLKTIQLLAISLALTTAVSSAAAQPALHLVPTPKQIKVSGGALHLAPSARIVAAVGELKPLAEVLRGDLLKLAGLKLSVSEGTARPGDIVLKLDGGLTAADARFWPHRITVADGIEIAGGDYNGVAIGTATLLQLLEIDAGVVRVPRLSISDYSAAEYPGLMLDVARQNNTLQDVRNCIDLCRLYKVRYLHLHLNDMESFMFPSKLFPKLGAHNRAAHRGPKCELWDRDELLATVRYGDERGVTLVPELETVFHTGAMMQDMPEEFGGPGVLNMGSEKLYRSLEPLIEEMCDVFKSSPYFHIGCDEASIGGVMEQPGTKEYMRRHGIANGEELYRFHIDRLDKIIARKGKRTIVWQDCPLPRDNKNIICMIWHIDFNHGDTAGVMRSGNPTIQVTWTPACGAPVKELLSWRPFDEQIRPGKLALGSQIVLWEQNGSVAVPYLRQKIPARQQVTYSPDAEITYPQFAANLAHTDALLDPLYSGISATEKGVTQSVAEWLAAGGAGPMPEYMFDKNLELALKTNVPGADIHYTVEPIARFNPVSLYGKPVTAKSPLAAGPITISPPDGEAVAVMARLFDAAGKPLGGAWSRVYRWQPYVVDVKGTVAEGDSRFGKAVEIGLRSSPAEGTVRYAVGGRLTASSPVFDKPLVVEKSGAVSIGYFDAAGKPRGLLWKQNFRKVDFDPTNVTYKKPVILWGNSTRQAAEVAVDGMVDHEQFLDIQPAPQQFAVDLEDNKTLDKVVLYTYWDGRRYYQYKIDVSTDRRQWTTVADASRNRTVATEHGYRHTFPPVTARYIRVTMLHNSANPGLHIIQLRAYESK